MSGDVSLPLIAHTKALATTATACGIWVAKYKLGSQVVLLP